MQISFDKFLKLTAVLAGSASIASACTIETVDGAKGGAAGASGQSQGGLGGAHAGTGGVDAGAPSSEGGAPSAGAGGQTEGGAGGAPAMEGTGGAGGVIGGAGGEGGAVACVSGAPAEEGLGFDCSTLSFAEARCPNPSGEGLPVPVPASEVCERYAAERQGSVDVLVRCLVKLSTADLCSATASARAAACERSMRESTCLASEAVAACTEIHERCDAIGVESCSADLSPLSPETVTKVRDCTRASDSTQCAYTYGKCRGLPDQALNVSSVCAALTAECPALPLETCKATLDIYGTGMILDLTYYSYRDCIAKSTATCDAAFAACTD
ncbi:MAG TPA: hypothetical protein VFQ35_26655 [Polyangiaceae bacterium]|nr:hypothetical protein [Polyangiaceae bacterium]